MTLAERDSDWQVLFRRQQIRLYMIMKRNKEKISGTFRHFYQRFSAIEAILPVFGYNLGVKNVCEKLAFF